MSFAIDKTRELSRAAPATPSSVEHAHRLLQRSTMKQVYVPLRASTLSPMLDQPESITELPPTVEDVALSLTVEDVALPPTVEQVAHGEQQIPLGNSLIVNQDTAPSMPPSKAAEGQTLDNNNNPYNRCAAHQLCLSMGNQTSQFLMCIDCNEPVHIFCAEYLIEQTPVNEDTLLYITVQDFTKEGKARWSKSLLDEKDNVAYCILCLAKMKAVKVLAEAKKLAKRQSGSSSKQAPKKKKKSTQAPTMIIRELCHVAAIQAQLYIFTKVEKTKRTLDIR